MRWRGGSTHPLGHHGPSHKQWASVLSICGQTINAQAPLQGPPVASPMLRHTTARHLKGDRRRWTKHICLRGKEQENGGTDLGDVHRPGKGVCGSDMGVPPPGPSSVALNERTPPVHCRWMCRPTPHPLLCVGSGRAPSPARCGGAHGLQDCHTR